MADYKNKKIILESWAEGCTLPDERAQILLRNVLKTGRPVVRYGPVVFLIMMDKNGFQRQPMTKDDMYAEFEFSTLYMVRKREEDLGDGKAKLQVYPAEIPYRYVGLAMGKISVERNLYEIRNIVTNPIVNRNGDVVCRNGLRWKEAAINRRKVRMPELNLEDGYDEVSGDFFAVPERVTGRLAGIGDLKPTDEQVLRALGIIDDFICDFSFSSDSARASAVAFMLTMVCRDIIGESVPMLEVRAPRSQSGKTKLVNMMLKGITGEEPSSFSPNFRDTREFEQELFSELLRGRNYIFMDDVGGTVRSNFLNSALTKKNISKRVLGVSSTAAVYSGMPFVMTANNPKLSEDIKNRVYLLSIDKPPAGKKYRHEYPLEYAGEKSPDLLWALLVLYRNWVGLGCPPFSGTVMEGYPEWSRKTGGMLEAARIPGFLADTLRQIAEPEQWEVRAAELAAAIYGEVGSAPISIKEMVADRIGADGGAGKPGFAQEAGYVKESDSQKSREQTMAGILKGLRDAPLPEGYKFVRTDDKYGSVWKVVKDDSDK